MAWQVWRQDDNGNRFLVGTYSARDIAERRLAELGKLPHKQFYWVSESPDSMGGNGSSALKKSAV